MTASPVIWADLKLSIFIRLIVTHHPQNFKSNIHKISNTAMSACDSVE